MTTLSEGLREARRLFLESPALGFTHALYQVFTDPADHLEALELCIPQDGEEILDRAIEEAEKREAE